MMNSTVDEMDRMFARLPLVEQMRRQSEMAGIDANVTVESTEDGYVVLADLPGFEADEFDVSVRDGVLVIEGNHEVSEAGEGRTVDRTRRIHERVRLGEDLLVEEATASYRNGVLEITVPTAEPVPESHRIDVE